MTMPPVPDPGSIPGGTLWVFAYGSLMWRPDFPYREKASVVVHGYHRALCMYSYQYRGTKQRPGLIFGLDRGGSCRGLAFRIAKSRTVEVLEKLWRREMVTAIYRPRWLSTALPDGRAVRVLAFVADPAHEQYAGRPSDDEALRLVLQGKGSVGPCLDYIENTLQHLEELGIHDPHLRRIINLAASAGRKT
jgi:cation transport protein ChaC